MGQKLEDDSVHHSLLLRMLRAIAPIRRSELKKFTPICLIFFLLTFVYDLLRPLKSALIIAEPGVGAELIPYIKVWGVLPGAVVFTALVMKLSSHLSREKVFYAIASLYIFFYLFFIFYIYPNREWLAPDWLAQLITTNLPHGLHNFAVLFTQWPVVSFYCMTELWGNILLSMLFWGFANEVNSMNEARRFYPLFLLAANSAAIFSGQVGAYLSEIPFHEQLGFGNSAWEQSLLYFVLVGIAGTGVIMVLYRHVNRVLFTQTPPPTEKRPPKKSPKMKLTIGESFRHVIRSPHLAWLTTIVLAYNLVFNLSDILWTHEMNKAYGDDINGYTFYTSQVTTVTGFISVFISLFVTGNVLRKLGWRSAAAITPTMVMLAAFGFYALLLLRYTGIELDFGSLIPILDPFHITLLFGTIQMSVSRGCKYTVFDTTKEIAFIPLPAKEQRLGKAVIDGIGSRLGKSSGSFIYQVLFLVLPSLDQMIPIVSVIVFLMLFLWLFAVKALSKNMQNSPAPPC